MRKTQESNRAVVQARNFFIDAMGDFFSYWTNNRFAGRLYGLLFFQNEPLSLDEISRALGTTKTTVSTHIRQLHRQGLVKRVYMPGQPRKDFYEVVPDDYRIAYLERKLEELSASIGIVTKCQDLLKSATSDITPEQKQEIKLYVEKLDKIRNYCEVVEHIYLKIKEAIENELLQIVLSVDTEKVRVESR